MYHAEEGSRRSGKKQRPVDVRPAFVSHGFKQAILDYLVNLKLA